MCTRSIEVADPAGDAVVYPNVEDGRLQELGTPVDITFVRLAIEGADVVYTLGLAAAPPRGDATETYRYWLGWSVAQPGSEPEYMDLRVGGTTTYESAALIGPDSKGLPYWGDVPGVWEGNNVEFRFPLSEITEPMGGPVELGGPRSGSDGPHRTGTIAQGPPFSAPYMIDDAGDGLWEPLPSCDVVSSAAGEPRSEPRAVPGLGAMLPLIVLGALAAYLRRGSFR